MDAAKILITDGAKMNELTKIERMQNFFKRQPLDRIPVYEAFWGDTRKSWEEKGWINPGEDLITHFDYDLRECWPMRHVADLDFKEVIVEETEETKLVLDGNGALLRSHKLHDATPEHVDFSVKTRKDWEEKIKPYITPSERRLNLENYTNARDLAKAHGQFFMWGGANVFECMHPVCGHEYMLMGMALDPDWIKDMAMTYAKQIVSLWEILFEKEGQPDGIYFFEDMGFKGRPFMSPQMYKEILQPAHKYAIDYAKSKKLPVMMHSCGFIEPLLPGMMEAGIDALQAMEVKAGMDVVRLYKQFGDRISFMGGIDVRTLFENDKRIIDEELEKKIPIVKQNFGYALHSDHSIPNTVDYPTYKYFIEKGLELGTF